MLKRYLENKLLTHLQTYRQMVFLVGPRQVGKTTMAKGLIPNLIDGVNYFNWDIPEHRRILSTQIFNGRLSLADKEKKVIIFDEIHKYHRWKNTLKGLFDKYEPDTHWIVTGSASLNVFRKGQDSLVGRCFTYNLAPLSVAELMNNSEPVKTSFDDLLKKSFSKPNVEKEKIFNLLLNFSGFPEPYLNATSEFLSRWRSARLDKLINQDLAATETLKHLPMVEQLMFLMPERAGSPLSINSLREDLEVHFATVKHWMELLERVYYGFTVRPYAKNSARALKKESKWYLYDWTEISDMGTRFENLVAVHLLKYVNFMNDAGLDNLSLNYIRDKEKREVDFLICRRRKPEMLVECKLKDTSPHAPLGYYASKLGIKRAVQLVADSIQPQTSTLGNNIAIDVISAAEFLKELA